MSPRIPLSSVLSFFRSNIILQRKIPYVLTALATAGQQREEGLSLECSD
jgi:hypothetical protein